MPVSAHSGTPHQMTSSTFVARGRGRAGVALVECARRHHFRAVSKMIPDRTPDRSTGGRGYTISRLSHQDLPVYFRAGGLETHLTNNFAAFFKFVTLGNTGGGTQPCDPFGLTPCVAVLTR